MAARQVQPSAGDPARQSFVDPISGLPNRRQFLADRSVSAEPGTLVLVTLADARSFNEILRALGHERSEVFIQTGARHLADLLPAGTTIYHVSILSFAFVLPAVEPPNRPDAVAPIISGFARPLLCDDIPIDTQVAVGLKATGSDGATPAEDLRAALAAAQDGRGTKGGWAWYDSRSDAAHKRAFRLLTDLKTALADADQLALHFQPKVCLGTGACASAEALLRWTHPDLGPIPPGEFIPLVEATALVTPLTRWVVAAAAAQVAAWRRRGIDIQLALNVSPKNLEEADFVEYLLFVCAAHDIPRSSLEIEITEGVNAGQGRLILDRLAAMRKLGFGIAIDDFGSGYSNMSYLTRLSAHTLKIDQSLIRGLDPAEQSGRLVAGIVRIGHDLGYRVVAEGIETEADRDLLAQWDCDIGQGWHFARPMTGDAFAAWYFENAARGSAARPLRA